jgi:hypothetical protein
VHDHDYAGDDHDHDHDQDHGAARIPCSRDGSLSQAATVRVAFDVDGVISLIER